MRKGLRPYQLELKPMLFEEWSKGHQNVLMQLPTGMGKTVLFSSVAIDFAVTPLNIMPTAILVHRKELVQQISLTLAEEEITHNIIAPKPTILGIVADQRRTIGRQFYDYNAPVTVVSVDTLIARIHKHEAWAKTIKFWITDEATHLLKNNKWGRAVSFFPNALGLGVTATPQRLDRRGLGRHADGVFDVMVEGPSTRWGIENGYLSKYKIAVPESDYRKFLRKTEGDSDYSREAMALASSQSRIIGDVVTNYLKFAPGKQAILFASDIQSAERMEAKFREAGVTAKLLTGETPDRERLDALLDYRAKKIKVLINVDLFDEGLDVPGIECVIMARPTMSLSKYLQMIGRGLRPIYAPGFDLSTVEGRLAAQLVGGKPFLIVIDHVGNVPEHRLPDSHRVWTLDRITKRRDRTNLLRVCQNFRCNSPFDRALTDCPYCGQEVFKNYRASGEVQRIKLQEVDGDLELLDPETIREMYEGVDLEDPGVVARRVGKVAGKYAADKAAKAQMERINVQKDLAELIALWAGKMKKNGYTDRQMNKLFYITYEMTMWGALAEPSAEMKQTMERLTYDLGDLYVERAKRERLTAISAN